MAKTTQQKPGTPAKSATTSAAPDSAAFAFGRENYILLIVSMVIVIIGYFLMSGGKATDPTIFTGEVFSFRRITLAPIVVLIGYIVGVYAIVKKAD